MGEVIQWCNDNEGFVSMLLSAITVLISLYVMYKSNDNSKKISEKQAELEKNIALRQEDMQRRQIKVDTYPYRLECWECLYRLKDDMEMLKTLFDTVNVYKLSFSDLSRRYKKLKINAVDTLLKLETSKNVFPVDTWRKIDKLKCAFLKIDNNFNIFQMFSEILTEKEQQEREKEKKELLQTVSAEIVSMLKVSSEVLRLVEGDLCIADLHSWKGIYDKEE